MSTNNEMVIQILLETQNVKSLDELRLKLEKSGVAADGLDVAIGELTAQIEKNIKATGKAATANHELAATLDEAELAETRLSEGIGANTGQTEKNTKAKWDNRKATEELTREEAAREKYLERLNAKMLESNILQKTAISNYSKTYQKLALTESLGSPQLMRTAQWGAVGLLGIGYASIKKYTEFNKLLVQSVTHAGRKMSEVPFFSKELLRISTETGQSANDLAESMYRVASGTAAWNKGLGASKEQVIELTRMVSDLTVIGNIKGGVQQEQAARVVTALVNSGMKGIGGEGTKGAAKRAAALINSAIGAGDIKMSEMVSSMGRGVMMSGKTAGLSASDVVSWIDLLTTHGTTGSVAGTYVKTAINQFLNPTSQGSKAYAMLGIDPFKLSEAASKGGLGSAVDLFKQKLSQFNPYTNYPKTKGAGGTQGAINQLQMWAANQFPKELLAHWKAGNLTPEEQDKVNSLIFTKAFGGSKGFTTMAMLIKESDRFHNIQSAIDRNATTKKFEEAKQLAENTPAMKFARMKNTVVKDLISIGESMTPVALLFAKFATSLIHFVTVFKPLAIGLASYLGVMIALALKAKTAGILRGMYGPIGSAYRMTDAVWGKVGGKWAKENIVNRGGAQFRAIEDEKRRELLVSMGQKFALFGSSVEAFSLSTRELEAVLTGKASLISRGPAGAARATRVAEEEAMIRASSGPAGRAGKTAAASSTGVITSGPATRGGPALDSAYIQRTSMLRGRFSKDEAAFARRFAEGGDLYGKKLTKAEIRRSMGYTRSKMGDMLTQDLYDKIGPHLSGGKYSPEAMDILRHKDFGTGRLRTAEEAAKFKNAGSLVSDAEEAASKGGLLSKLAGKLGGKSGMLGKMGGFLAGGEMLGSIMGGPIGMAAMMALPALLPMVSKAATFLSGGVGQNLSFAGVAPTTPTINETNRTKVKADLDKAISEFASGKRGRKQLDKINALQQRYNTLTGVKQSKTVFASRAVNNVKGLQSLVGQMGHFNAGGDVYKNGKLVESGLLTNGFISHALGHSSKTKLFTLKELSAAGISNEVVEGYQKQLKPWLDLAKKRGFIKNKDLNDPNTIKGITSHLQSLGIKDKKTGKFMSATGAVIKFMNNTLNMQTQGLTNPLLADQVNALDPNLNANSQFNRIKQFDKKNIGTLGRWADKKKFKFDTIGGAESKFFQLQTGAMSAIQQAQSLEKIAGQAGLSTANKTRYLKEADHLRRDAVKLQSAATQVAQKNALTDKDIRALSKALGNAVAANYGLTPEKFRDAMVQALTTAGGGIGALVNQYNTNQNART